MRGATGGVVVGEECGPRGETGDRGQEIVGDSADAI